MSLWAIYQRQWWRLKTYYLSWLMANILLFILSGIVAYFYVVIHPQVAQEALSFITDKMPTLKPGQSMFLTILERNTLASLTFIFLGLISGGVLTLISLLVNGGMVGALMGVFAIRGTINPLQLLGVGILPHGILEITAISLAGGLGIRLGYLTIKRLIKGGFSLKSEILESMLTFSLIIFPVLILAATIESTITPFLVNHFLPGIKE